MTSWRGAMAWRNDVAWLRTVGQQVLAGVDQPPWKLGYETQVSTARMYGTKRIYVFTGVASRARLPDIWIPFTKIDATGTIVNFFEL